MIERQDPELAAAVSLEKLDQIFDLLDGVREEMDLLRKLLVYVTDINFSSEEALQQWERILQHRNELRQRLDREVDLSVAIADYFTYIYKMPTSPLVLSRSRIDKLQAHASSDFLTGIYNRYFFAEFISKEIARADRQKASFSLILLDINNFKNVNDTYGHQKGDKVLASIATTIRTILRQQDIPCRYGGDEFICILPNTSYFNALGTTERIRRTITELSHQLGLQLKLSIAYGLATYPWDGRDADELVRACDRRLYENKTELLRLKRADRRTCQRVKVPGNRGALWKDQNSMAAEILDIGNEGIGLRVQEPLEVGTTYRVELFLEPPLTHAQAAVEVLHLQESRGYYRIGGRLRDLAFIGHGDQTRAY